VGEGVETPDGEDVSPSQANPIRPRYAYLAVANLPERGKPATGGEATSESTHRAVRGGWGGRASRDRSRNLGGPAWCPSPSGLGQLLWGNHNPRDGRGRESERPIVVRKRGNARGAKGPHFSPVSIQEESVDWAAKALRTTGGRTVSARSLWVVHPPLFRGRSCASRPSGSRRAGLPSKATIPSNSLCMPCGERLSGSRMREIRTSGSTRRSRGMCAW